MEQEKKQIMDFFFLQISVFVVNDISQTTVAYTPFDCCVSQLNSRWLLWSHSVCSDTSRAAHLKLKHMLEVLF